MPKDVWAIQQSRLRTEGWAALLLMAPENVTWSAGVEIPSQRIVRHRHAVVLMPAVGEPELLVVDVEEGYARSRSDIQRIRAYNEFTDRPMRIVAAMLAERGLRGVVGVETTYLNHSDYEELRQALPDSIELTAADAVIAELRSIKTDSEIERLRRAAAIAETVAFEGLQAWWPGMTEQDLAHRLADSFAALGGDKLTMLSVTAGERTTMLNGDATDRPIRQGDVVRIDVIGTVGNYYCDVARTAVVGVADPQLDDLWAKLVLCRDEALAMIRPGASTQAIYRRYVERLERWGLPVFHFLGHGLGLTLHEEPYLNRFSDIVLVPGMVLAVEPLVVLDQVGLQLEEAVVVTEDGYELLTGRHDLRQLWRMAEVVRQ